MDVGVYHPRAPLFPAHCGMWPSGCWTWTVERRWRRAAQGVGDAPSQDAGERIVGTLRSPRRSRQPIRPRSLFCCLSTPPKRRCPSPV